MIVDQVQRLSEAISRPRQPRVEGCHRERSQQLTALLVGRSFLERALEVDCGGVRRTASTGPRRRVLQCRCDHLVALRRALEKMAGNDVTVRPICEQRPCRLVMKAFGLGLRKVLQDRGSNQRMGKPLGVGGQQASRSEGIPRGGDLIQ